MLYFMIRTINLPEPISPNFSNFPTICPEIPPQIIKKLLNLLKKSQKSLVFLSIEV